MDLDFQEIVFAEGDLYVDSDSFQEVCHAVNNVITYNREPILANKAVAFYYDSEYRIHYIYDTQHSALRIQEPLSASLIPARFGSLCKETEFEILLRL